MEIIMWLALLGLAVAFGQIILGVIVMLAGGVVGGIAILFSWIGSLFKGGDR